MMRYLCLFTLLLCSACIQLGNEPHPTRYYLLEPVANVRSAANDQPLQLELSPIIFPSYLDRPQIVTHNINNSIQIAEYDRWAEPLSENLTRTLQENLRNQLPNVRISSAPWNQSSAPVYLLQLTVNRFDGVLGQQTAVDIRWTLVNYKTNTEIARRHFRAQLPIDENHRGLVDGLNSTLAELSQEIASMLTTQQ